MIATASVLLTTIMGVSRIVFAMGRSDDLPAFAGRLHPRFFTPHYAIWITGACMIAAILLADLALVIGVSTFAMLVYYLIANIAAMKIPSGIGGAIRHYPLAGTITCVGMIVFLNSNSWIIGGIGLET